MTVKDVNEAGYKGKPNLYFYHHTSETQRDFLKSAFSWRIERITNESNLTLFLTLVEDRHVTLANMIF
jgi:hypothetical protein